MSDTIDKRLQDTVSACITAYNKWNGAKMDSAIRAELQDTIHEIRKAIARLEIDIALSEREELSHNPIPVPAHRSNRRPSNPRNDASNNTGNNGNGDGDDDSDNTGNAGNDGNGGASQDIKDRIIRRKTKKPE